MRFPFRRDPITNSSLRQSSVSVLLWSDSGEVKVRGGGGLGSRWGQVGGWRRGFLGGTWVSPSPVSNLLLVISFWSLSAAVHLALTSWHTQQATCQHGRWREEEGGLTQRERGVRGERRGRTVVSGGEGERLKAVTLSGGRCVKACWWSSLAVGRETCKVGKMLSLKLKAEHDKQTRPELDYSVSTFYYKYLGPYSQNTQSLKAEKLNFRIHVFRGVSPKSDLLLSMCLITTTFRNTSGQAQPQNLLNLIIKRVKLEFHSFSSIRILIHWINKII